MLLSLSYGRYVTIVELLSLRYYPPHADSVTPYTATRASYESDTSYVEPETSYVLSFLL